MADKPVKPNRKRRVRNPETFRERALKATEQASGVARVERLKAGTGKASGKVTQPLKKLFGRKPLIWLRRPLRIIGRVLLPRYVRNSWSELRKVKWPARRESFRLTFAVLLFAAIFGAAIAVVDFGLDKLFKDILLK